MCPSEQLDSFLSLCVPSVVDVEISCTDSGLSCDRLIEKDYMEREEGNTYAYVA